MPFRKKHGRVDHKGLLVEAGRFLQMDDAWDDLRFPAQAINPAGQASAPDVDTANTGLLLFDDITTEVVAGLAQMPHAWREGSNIVPHVHWAKTTSAAGNVLWQLDYEVVANGDVAALNYPDQLQTSSVVDGTPDDDTANRMLISSFGEIDMTGHEASVLIFWKLSRIGGDAADTYGADALLAELDFHYVIDSLGSDEQFTKTDYTG